MACLHLLSCPRCLIPSVSFLPSCSCCLFNSSCLILPVMFLLYIVLLPCLWLSCLFCLVILSFPRCIVPTVLQCVRIGLRPQFWSFSKQKARASAFFGPGQLALAGKCGFVKLWWFLKKKHALSHRLLIQANDLHGPFRKVRSFADAS